MSEVLAVQHIRCETVGTIADALSERGVSVKTVRIFEGQRLPHGMRESAGLIIMGGPMGAYEQDRYPFLRQEIHLIEEALRQDKPILGVCLGSQLLAAALGAKVTKGQKKEIGWHRIRLTPVAASDRLWAGIKSSFVAYHWHGDVFELPAGAVSLASSDLTLCQAFRYGQHAYGFLFHMEITETMIQEMLKTFSDELQAEGIQDHEILEGAQRHLAPLQKIGGFVFQRWADLASKKREADPFEIRVRLDGERP